ncbi:regulator of Vps4 activity in the MVB pathway-domain-containing protein [Panaeolus papilionaceus]|nr:regulator of Vps4 activity in the MVB pathway-domain-containing protein [Panaeolus papilionaceus]
MDSQFSLDKLKPEAQLQTLPVLVPAPRFMRARTLAFSLIAFFAFLWIVIISVMLFAQWDSVDRHQRPFMVMLLLLDSVTLVMIPILIIQDFRPWLDAARFLFLILLHGGLAITFAVQSKGFACPPVASSVDQQAICDLMILALQVMNWVIPVLALIYASVITLYLYKPERFMSNLRPSIQKLGQIQAKNDAQANITRADISILIQQGDFLVAREKAEKVIQDEAFGDLLEELEAHVGTLIEGVGELENELGFSSTLAEAAANVVYAAPHVPSKELESISAFLRFAFKQDPIYASKRLEDFVSPRIRQSAPPLPPSAYQVDAYMYGVVKSYNLTWMPEVPRQNLVNVFSELLNPGSHPEIDIEYLRKLCLRGVPDQPDWLRPKVWKLLLGTLPGSKAGWSQELKKQRDSYYELVQRLLKPFSQLSDRPDSRQLDDALSTVFKALSGLHGDAYVMLEEPSEGSELSPLCEQGPEGSRISVARALDDRVVVLQNKNKDKDHPAITAAPEIRLDEVPGISLTSADETIDLNDGEGDATSAKTLLASRQCMFGTAHPMHCSALLRLLYLHYCLNPGNVSPHSAAVLVPIYTVMVQELEPEDLAHAEADAFWVFESVMAELAGLEDEGGEVYMRMLSERVSGIDFDYFVELQSLGLDPAAPHYSFRWLMPILTHTLPMRSIFVVWDTLFARPPRTKDQNLKLDFLVDVCAAMLIRAKHTVSRLSQVSQTQNHSLWMTSSESSMISTQNGRKAEDAFAEALALLRDYDVRAFGGIDRIIQIATDIHRRPLALPASQSNGPSLAERLRNGVWGAIPAVKAPEPTPEVQPARTPSAPAAAGGGLASRLTNSIWRGITNQSAMDDEDATPPPSPQPSPQRRVASEPGYGTVREAPAADTTQQPPSNLWGYAQKIKNADAVATLSKARTNLRARSILGSWTSPTSAASTESEFINGRNEYSDSQSPTLYNNAVSESPLASPTSAHSQPAYQQHSPSGSITLIEKTKSLLAINRSTPPAAPATPKSAPRPLFLNSGTTIISSSSGRKSDAQLPSARSSTSAEAAHAGYNSLGSGGGEWADVMNAKRQHFHRGSQSSISVSSLSPSDAFSRPSALKSSTARSDWDSDTSQSRIVALNRRSVSPMAPNFRVAHARPSSRASSSSSGIPSPPHYPKTPTSANEMASSIKSPSQLKHPSPMREVFAPAPKIPMQAAAVANMDAAADDSDATSGEPRTMTASISRRTLDGATTMDSEDTADSSSAKVGMPIRSQRVRAKRYTRPANLQIPDIARSTLATGAGANDPTKSMSPSSLGVEWPEEEDMILTPKASGFMEDAAAIRTKSPRRQRKLSGQDSDRPRKSSTDDVREERPRKISSGARTRKISAEARARRNSAAEEGDDEGYDELLSAYESEDFPESQLRA